MNKGFYLEINFTLSAKSRPSLPRRRPGELRWRHVINQVARVNHFLARYQLSIHARLPQCFCTVSNNFNETVTAGLVIVVAEFTHGECMCWKWVEVSSWRYLHERPSPDARFKYSIALSHTDIKSERLRDLTFLFMLVLQSIKFSLQSPH